MALGGAMRRSDTKGKAGARATDGGGMAGVLLGDVCEVAPSPSSDLLPPLTLDGKGPAVVTPADITDAGGVAVPGLRRLPGTPGDEFLARFRLLPGDIVVVRLGAVGRVGLVDGAARGGWVSAPPGMLVYHSSCIRLRPDSERVEPSFLAAYLAHPPVADHMVSRAHLGTVPMLTAGVLRDLPVFLPPMHRQKLMAKALREVGEQMDLYHRMIGKLGAQKEGMLGRMLADEFEELDTSGVPRGWAFGGASASRASGVPAVPPNRVRLVRTRRTSRLS
ncbi:restriction endonuclease subunit S [Streptomyces sp. NPDC006655]|uniref:restriction endonuclease subunit S n=1 Tax=Streptomyces sp. NPDC006655 TaxID=3156898 RepID=UPI003453ECBF